MKGQLEASFQWIFVLLAGLVFLTMFFFLFRSCTQQGDARVQGIAVDSAARQIEAAVWQPKSSFNMTIQPVEVRCPAGTMTLTADLASASVDRAPVFLPPSIGGRLQVVADELAFTGEVAPSIVLGNILYGLDEETYYLLITDGTGAYPLDEYVGEHPNIRPLPVTEMGSSEAVLALVPDTARTVVLVAENEGYVANTAVEGFEERVTLVGVAITQTGATFFSRQEGTMTKLLALPTESVELEVGAIVAFDPGTYRCGRDNFLKRLSYVTDVYYERIQELSASAPVTCTLTYKKVNETLSPIVQAEGDVFLQQLFLAEDDLVELQDALLRQSCPVIA